MDLAALPSKNIAPSCLASALARSALVSRPLHDELVQVNSVMMQIIRGSGAGENAALETYVRLLSMNAALSRFSSQAFSGIPPVTETESHFWIHSLLGTGVANIALNKLAGYVEGIMGAAKLPERIAVMRSRTHDVPDLERLTNDPDFLIKDHLREVKLPDGAPPIHPLVTYFSGRDGYSSHLQTLSAPLTAIAECNSYRSSLLTITHELSHIFIQGMLGDIYPDANDQAQVEQAWGMSRRGYQAPNWLDAIRQLLIEALVSMEQTASGDSELPVERITPDFVRQALRDWRREAQEIMVHTFDFLYFYGGDARFYLKGIWNTWCSVPGIGQRVAEYVLRSLCAISPRLLREKPALRAEAARRELEEALRELKATRTLLSNYVDPALDHIAQNWDGRGRDQSILRDYRDRLYLVRLVLAFLHSDSIAAQLFRDPHLVGGTRTGYAKRQNEYDLEPIANPLRFLREYLKESPTEAESLWVLHNLAFNVSRAEST